jgi:2-aminoethylphosphonate-pyruvate transaminase
MTRPLILLNPGPVTLTERVRSALAREDQCHREPEFAQLVLDVRGRLSRVYPEAEADFTAILLTGSGTCAVEAMLASLLPYDGKTLIVANGVYGERMTAMARAHGKPFEVIQGDWLSGLDLTETERRLRADASITHVAAVHNETTTGRLNDVAALGELCRAHARALLLDTVSSFGAEEIDFPNWNLEAVAATANKCLHGAPGIAFALVRKSVLQARPSQARSLYLDLFRYYHDQQSGFSPYTQAVHVCFALQEALMELEEAGGVCARRQRYRRLSSAIRGCLCELGVRELLPAAAYCSMISSFLLPAGMSYAHIHDRLREAGFVIYAGQGDLARTIFRVANMGDIGDEDLMRLLQAFQDVFKTSVSASHQSSLPVVDRIPRLR